MSPSQEAPLSKVPKLVFTGIRTQCDKKCKKVIRFLDKHENEDHFDQDMVEELNSLMQKLTEQHNHMGTQWNRYMGVIEDVQKFQEITTLVEEVEIEVDKVLQRAKDTFKAKAKKPKTQPAAQATQSGRRWKSDDFYKPTKLYLSDSPIALETWISRLKSYLQGHEEQPHNNLFNLLDEFIEDKIKSKVGFNRTDKMNIFGKDSLIEKIQAYWEEEYPVNRLRMALLDLKSGQNELRDSWRDRFFTDFNKADFLSLSVADIGNLLCIMNYQGPHTNEIKKKFGKATIGENKNKINIDEAGRIFREEQMSVKLCESNSVKKLHNQNGKYNNNKGNNQNNGKGNNPKSHAVYGKGQTRPGEKAPFKLEDTPKGKELIAQNKCLRCASTSCPNSTNKDKCPKFKELSCGYCKKQQKEGRGHVEAACVRKHTDKARQSVAHYDVKQLYEAEAAEDTSNQG